jgi:hypothetical protein
MQERGKNLSSAAFIERLYHRIGCESCLLGTLVEGHPFVYEHLLNGRTQAVTLLSVVAEEMTSSLPYPVASGPR